jgi:asparagine synthase (glutamine-hydrolysing)
MAPKGRSPDYEQGGAPDTNPAMCGIAGTVTSVPNSESRSVLEAMTGVLRHRGPDGDGYYQDEWAALGHRRLSIIDLAAGAQPMSSESGELWCTYNGEIFNHAEIRRELEAAGHVYTTRCDTETILHAYEQFGAGCVARFRGMFAFAIWNKAERSLFCARDRLGKKPFYYFFNGRLFVFASEIKALLKHPAVSPALEESVLAEHLSFGYVSGEQTLFRGVQKLMPGHTLLLTQDAGRLGLRITRYWDLPRPGEGPAGAQHEAGRPLDEQGWIDECRRRLEESVRTRLMSDVPLGMFLSGGVDSSIIAALMKRLTPGPVKTFSVGYAEREYSELEPARQVARHIGTEHHEVSISMDDFFQALPNLVWHEDEPIAWPSSVSLYFVSKLASEQVKVVLTGEGSDELFGGYGRYRYYRMNSEWARYYRLLPGFSRRVVSTTIAESGLLSAPVRRKLQHTFLGRGDDMRSLYLDNFYAAFSEREQRLLLPHAAGNGHTPYDCFLGHWNRYAEAPLLSRMLYADQKTYLVELLMKQDQMSMAASIESRVPFLDHPLAEFAAAVPESLKLRGKVGKYILKKAAEDLLPREIVYRRKMGFPTPLRDWLQRPESAELMSYLQPSGGLLACFTDKNALAGLLERHRNGVEDATDRIWRLLNLQLWGDIHVTGRPRAVWPRLIAAGCAQ